VVNFHLLTHQGGSVVMRLDIAHFLNPDSVTFDDCPMWMQ
jgi:hypothetical protein